MPYKNQKVQKKYQQDWYIRKKHGLPTKSKNIIIQPKAAKLEQQKLSNKNLREEKHRLMDEGIGAECCICGKSHLLINHRKDGIRHTDLINLALSGIKKVIKSGKFVRLCPRCHGCVHWCMKYLKMKWEDIKLLLEAPPKY